MKTFSVCTQSETGYEIKLLKLCNILISLNW